MADDSKDDGAPAATPVTAKVQVVSPAPEAQPQAAAPQPQAINTAKVDGIAIPGADHATAKELFASLLATAQEDVKAIAREIGKLLHLHSAASGQADVTGDYKPGDLDK